MKPKLKPIIKIWLIKRMKKKFFLNLENNEIYENIKIKDNNINLKMNLKTTLLIRKLLIKKKKELKKTKEEDIKFNF